MIHPVLTALFDLFLIGSALAVGGGMLAEYFVLREPHVGSFRRTRPAARTRTMSQRRGTIHRFPAPRTRRAA
jgi:hypothetical protein